MDRSMRTVVLCAAMQGVRGGLGAMPAEIEGIGPQRAGVALGFLMLIGRVGRFLLPALSGTALQARGFSAAMGRLAIAHLAIVLPALGLRDRRAQSQTPVLA